MLPTLSSRLGIQYLSFDADETGEPYARRRDARVLTAAREAGVRAEPHATETLWSLEAYEAKCGGMGNAPGTMTAYQSLLGRMGKVLAPVDAPVAADYPSPGVQGELVGAAEMLVPSSPLALPWPRETARAEVESVWGPAEVAALSSRVVPALRGGESAALERLEAKIQAPGREAWVAAYDKPKTAPTALTPSTTALSPYLSLGCVSPRDMWHAVDAAAAAAPKSAARSKPPVSLHGQLMWRDFNNLVARAANDSVPGSWGQMEGNRFCRQVAWGEDKAALAAWAEGRTGYPWIDACMTQLRAEGWIHHLGRHAVACFLTRGDLWQHWEAGAAHFEAQLLDADYALNGFNWLWLSCSGFFYQYFRCYSPVAFQKKKDPSGAYIRKYLPQLARLPDKYIYEPWKAPPAVQKAAGVIIGQDYPEPIVDHAVVSKANMSKMADAYAKHKALNGGGSGAPAKKKQKR